jgi:predicted membrane channel-forming protein YqfA (hemolysin III family)
MALYFGAVCWLVAVFCGLSFCSEWKKDKPRAIVFFIVAGMAAMFGVVAFQMPSP